MRSPGFTHRQGVLLVACVMSLLIWSDTARAQSRGRGRVEKRPAAKFDLDSWGQLGKLVKGSADFYELTYYKKTGEGRKAKVTKTKAFLKIPAETLLYEDIRIRLGQLKENEDVVIFGKHVSRDVPDQTGRGRRGVDSQIQNASVVLSGELHGRLPFNRQFSDPRRSGHKWCEAKVTKSGGGLAVDYEGINSRVTMARGAPILKRMKANRKRLRNRVYVQLFGKKTAERPETKKKSDAKKESFEARLMVILDRGSLKTVYPLMWKR